MTASVTVLFPCASEKVPAFVAGLPSATLTPPATEIAGAEFATAVMKVAAEV